MRAQVVALVSSGQNVNCGVVGADTKFILRSCSARIFWLVQMSTEMWEFADDGEMYFEKFVEKFLGVLFQKWQAIAVSHALTVVFFSRSYYDKDQFPSSFDPTSKTFTESHGQGYGFGSTCDGCANGYGPTIDVDSNGRLYEDFYMVVVKDYTGPDWLSLIHLLKCKFNEFPGLHRWRLPGQSSKAEYIFKGISGSGEPVVQWNSLPYGVPARASEGNMLEAINVCLTVLEKHYMDRDLERTGQSIVMISAGCGVFKVQRHLAHITKQRMMDNGIGMDMLSLAMSPLHNVPLFIWESQRKTTESYSDEGSGYDDIEDRVFNIPHWINISFLDLDDSSQKVEGEILYSQTVMKRLNFSPLPSFRMFDLTSPTEPKLFPVLLRCLLAKPGEPKKERERGGDEEYADQILHRICDSLGDMSATLYPQPRGNFSYSPSHSNSMMGRWGSIGQLPQSSNFRSSNDLISLGNIHSYDGEDIFSVEVLAHHDTAVFTHYRQHISTQSRQFQSKQSPRKMPYQEYDSTTPTLSRNMMNRGRSNQPRSSAIRISSSTLDLGGGSSNNGVKSPNPSQSSKSKISRSLERKRGFSRPPTRMNSLVDSEATLFKSPDESSQDTIMSNSLNNLDQRSPHSVGSMASDDHDFYTCTTPKQYSSTVLSRAFSGTSMAFGSPAVNPFQGIPEFDVSLRLTSNRRRWSHLFPSTEAEFKLHAGPNWKSLVSPAALPLTTDYYPLQNDLLIGYTESFYALTLTLHDSNASDGSIPAYTNHLQLVTEMVCQRLTGNFQLVAADAGVAVDSRTRVPAGSTKRGPGGESRDSHCIVYHLSMGHRIHQIIYDEELQTIEVKRYVKRMAEDDSNQPYIYRYSLWVPQTQSFHPSLQEFYEYPTTEYNWNYLDQVLCGYYDEMPEQTKCRRIRFCLIPVAFSTTQEEADYLVKFHRFLEFLQGRVGKASQIEVKIESMDSPKTQTRSSSTPTFGKPSSIYKISLNNPNPSISKIRQEWIVLVLDSIHDTKHTFHFEFRWLACSGGVLMDFISAVYRKCQQIGVELRRFPEYARVSYVQIHPLLAPVFLPIPFIFSCDYVIASQLLNKFDFIFDDCVFADANGVGFGLGIEKLHAGTTRQMNFKQKNKRVYTQYMHRTLPVFVRIMESGVLWLPYYSSDVIQSLYNKLNEFIEALVISQQIIRNLVNMSDDTEEREGEFP